MFESPCRTTRETLQQRIERLRDEEGDGFPDRVTAFRDPVAVHGRYRKPCPVGGAPVQRIRHASSGCDDLGCWPTAPRHDC